MAFSEAWKKIMDEVREFQESNLFTWFRGQHKVSEDFRLNSSLFREDLKDKGVRNIDLYMNKERLYYNIFKSMGHIYHNEIDWNLLFVMQHHGVRTRLLDWSESFAVALYFAFQKWDDKDTARIWMLNPIKMNDTTHNGTFFVPSTDSYEQRLDKRAFFDNSVALYPIRNSERIVAQQGVFTLQGNSMQPMEEELDGKFVKTGVLKKIDLSPSLKQDVKMYLKQCGINPFALFPDLVGLAEYLNEQYGNMVFVNKVLPSGTPETS